MGGIYVHIPFCKKACFYCDFHFSISRKTQPDVVKSIISEMEMRKNMLERNAVKSVYFGGGTPSILTLGEIENILNQAYTLFEVEDTAEITLECNPDDLDEQYLKGLKDLGFNRLSIGIQSFNDDHLQWMNRSHNNTQSMKCIESAAEVGFQDLTIDLIYGLPQLNMEEWKATVDQALQLPINHLSAYSLTLEESTPYHKLVSQKKYEKPNNEEAAKHYNYLNEAIREIGWQQYEVSNYCKNENYAKHNTSYWQHKKYLGLGPSAHSYDLENRYWNVRSNQEYIDKILTNKTAYEVEKLSLKDQFNEEVLTGLRTKWGVELVSLKSRFGEDVLNQYEVEISTWKANNWIKSLTPQMVLTTEGMLYADYIASELFRTEEF